MRRRRRMERRTAMAMMTKRRRRRRKRKKKTVMDLGSWRKEDRVRSTRAVVSPPRES